MKQLKSTQPNTQRHHNDVMFITITLEHARKKIVVGQKCLILQPDDTSSRTFSRWKGPAEVVEVKSPHSYIVELDGKQMHIHANYLRPFHVRVDEVKCNCSELQSVIDNCFSCLNCSIIYENDSDFGNVEVIDTSASRGQEESLPSQLIDRKMLDHLSGIQQTQLLDLLDEFGSCFSQSPGLCTAVMHKIPTTPGFVPKRLRPYRIPENLKAEVNAQIAELLRLGFITESNSAMASPVVAVLKPHGRGVRVCVNYQYVNKHTLPDQTPLTDISEIIQKVGRANFISLFDANSGYHQCMIVPEDRWKTAFCCDSAMYEWVRCPFGLRGSGCTFVRAIRKILYEVRDCVESYVDDMAVHTFGAWMGHLSDLRRFLEVIQTSGFTLNLSKCSFGQSEIKFVGHVIGSGKRRADPDKVESIKALRVPETKKQVRQILGLFGHFRDYIENYATHAKPLTDLTGKRVPNRVPWGEREQKSFDTLKHLLIEATVNPIQIIDCRKPFGVFVDACDYATGSMLVQVGDDGSEQPVAFASYKFTPTQKNWPVIQKEAYAIIWALNKFKHWVFGAPAVTVYTDHNPLTYLTDTAPKSAKLMRWLLALQEFSNVSFCFRAGSINEAADCMSWMVHGEGAQPGA